MKTKTRETKSIEEVKFKLTEEEKLAAGARLARAITELAELEARRKEVAEALSAEKKRLEKECLVISRSLENGWVWREVECDIFYDQPRPGMKSIVRSDTGAVDREEPMTDDEKQMDLSLGL
jgi:hypothetical protein